MICSQSFAAENLAQREQELANLDSAIDEIQSWLQEANARQSDEEKRLQSAQENISGLSQSVRNLNASIDGLIGELRVLQSRGETLQNNKAEQSQLLMQLLRATHMAGEDSPLKLLLNMEEPAQQDRMQFYYQRFTEAQLQTIAAYRATLAEIEQVDAALRTNLDELNSQQRQVVTELDELERAREQQASALAQLTASIGSRRQELEQLQIDRQQLEQLIEQINQSLDGFPVVGDGVAFSSRQGELPLPADGRIVSRFGARFGGGNLTRQGVIIGLETGTPVRAIHPGRVVFADWLRGAGLLVILDHGGGYMSLYGNNDALAVEPGAMVQAGAVVATSGRIPGNGNDAAIAGLYFEIRHRGSAQDPGAWLAAGN